MVSSGFKPAVSRFIEPFARAAAKAGVTPDAVTLFGTIGSIAASLFFYPRGELVIGTILVSLFVLSDLFDGAIARISQRGPSRWGAFLDSTCDRLTDSAILAALAVYCVIDDNIIFPVVIAAMIAGFLVPYIRAKSESFGIECTIGIAERTERLILALLTIGLHGLGVPYILAVGMWILLFLSVLTVLQRIVIVRKGLKNQ